MLEKVRARRPHRAGLLVTLGAIAAVAVAAPAAAQARPHHHHHKPKPAKVSVMTRNLYLGADLTPGVEATSLQGLVDAAGVILNQVDDNKFATRAKGLAGEILKKKPDLVGMQEVSDWRTEACTLNVFPPAAKHVRYDYLKLLLNQLNKGKKRYRVVISEPEFDFEVPVNYDGDQNTGTDLGSGPIIKGCEFNGRLTMRDVILARVGDVKTSKTKGSHFDTLLQESPGGVNTDVTRGWTRTNAKVKGAPKFRFVNTHLEAFDSNATNHTNHDTDLGKGEIREAQAKELVKHGGPATGSLPVILVGDLNSDDNTVQDGDRLAYNAIKAAGLKERSTDHPLGCCLNASLITAGGGGSIGDFDHQVDHILTDSPKKVKLVKSSVTGRQPVNGFWDSDHAGLFSELQFK